MNEIEITKKVSYDTIASLLCDAFEGGSNYWYEIVKYEKPEKIWIWKLPTRSLDEPPTIYKHIQYPLSIGGAVIIRDNESENKGDNLRLDLDAIHRGIQIMAQKYPHHFANVINENDDAITGDVFLQCCLFGELIYG